MCRMSSKRCDVHIARSIKVRKLHFFITDAISKSGRMKLKIERFVPLLG